MVKVGIIGTGIMGAGHARFIRDHVVNAKVVALADIDADRVHNLALEIGDNVAEHSSVEEFFSSPGIDAVIIASPDQLHTQHLRIAMASGLPTLCEKPIATTLEDARTIATEITSYEKSKGKHLIHFGFMRRFDPAYVEVKRLIETGDYGLPLFLRTVTRNVISRGITTPSLYTNIAIHDFDIFRWLFTDEWVSVSSHYPRKSSLSPKDLADPLVITAYLKSGIMMLADIVANNNYGYDVRTEVVCEKGSIEIGIHGDVITRANHVSGVLSGGAMDENWIPRFKDAYIAELRAWVDSIESGINNPNLATVDDALAANEICALGVASI